MYLSDQIYQFYISYDKLYYFQLTVSDFSLPLTFEIRIHFSFLKMETFLIKLSKKKI